MIEHIFTSCRSVWARAEGVDDELGEIYRAGARLCAGRPVAGSAGGQPAVYDGAPVEGAFGRRGRLGCRPDRSRGRELSPGADRGRSRPRQTAEGRGIGVLPALQAVPVEAPVR